VLISQVTQPGKQGASGCTTVSCQFTTTSKLDMGPTTPTDYVPRFPLQRQRSHTVQWNTCVYPVLRPRLQGASHWHHYMPTWHGTYVHTTFYKKSAIIHLHGFNWIGTEPTVRSLYCSTGTLDSVQ